MKILAIDTSMSACSAAILNTEAEPKVNSYCEAAPMRQTQLILPMIDRLLRETSLSVQDLDAIAYSGGPGSYTGIRIACSVAHAISFAAGIPIIKISTLQALAQTAYIKLKISHIMVAVDARLSQIYWSCYKVGSSGLMEPLEMEIVCSPGQLKGKNLNFHSSLEKTRWHGVGDGWINYADLLKSQLKEAYPVEINTLIQPEAEAMLPLAAHYMPLKSLIFEHTLPTYLR